MFTMQANWKRNKLVLSVMSVSTDVRKSTGQTSRYFFLPDLTLNFISELKTSVLSNIWKCLHSPMFLWSLRVS
jgi:hypothetical protein